MSGSSEEWLRQRIVEGGDTPADSLPDIKVSGARITSLVSAQVEVLVNGRPMRVTANWEHGIHGPTQWWLTDPVGGASIPRSEFPSIYADVDDATAREESAEIILVDHLIWDVLSEALGDHEVDMTELVQRRLES